MNVKACYYVMADSLFGFLMNGSVLLLVAHDYLLLVLHHCAACISLLRRLDVITFIIWLVTRILLFSMEIDDV